MKSFLFVTIATCASAWVAPSTSQFGKSRCMARRLGQRRAIDQADREAMQAAIALVCDATDQINLNQIASLISKPSAAAANNVTSIAISFKSSYLTPWHIISGEAIRPDLPQSRSWLHRRWSQQCWWCGYWPRVAPSSRLAACGGMEMCVFVSSTWVLRYLVHVMPGGGSI